MNWTVILILFFGMVGPGVVLFSVGAASVDALGRNPAAAPKILLAMIISLVFAQSISVVALLVTFQVFVPS